MAITLLLNPSKSLLELNSKQTSIIITLIVFLNLHSTLGILLFRSFFLNLALLLLLFLNRSLLDWFGGRSALLDGLVLLNSRNIIAIFLLDGLVDTVESILSDLVV